MFVCHYIHHTPSNLHRHTITAHKYISCDTCDLNSRNALIEFPPGSWLSCPMFYEFPQPPHNHPHAKIRTVFWIGAQTLSSTPPMFPNLSQMNPVRTLSHSTSLRSHLLLSSYLRPGFECRLFHTKTITIHLLSHTTNMSYTDHLHCFVYPNNISRRVQIMKPTNKEASQNTFCCLSFRFSLYISRQRDLAKP